MTLGCMQRSNLFCAPYPNFNYALRMQYYCFTIQSTTPLFVVISSGASHSLFDTSLLARDNSMPTNFTISRIATGSTDLLVAIAFFLTSCGGGGSGTQGPSSATLITSDATPCHGAPANPTTLYLVICYPTPYANLVAANSTVVAGRIIDPDGNPINAGDITSIEVNGVAATLDPGDASYWSVSISADVAPGQSTTMNAVADFTTDPDSAVSLEINNSALLNYPIDMVLDPSDTNYAYIVDADLQSLLYNILHENLVTGESVTFSGYGYGTGTDFSSLSSAVVDQARNLLYVSDFGAKKIVKVDLNTGNRLGSIPTPAITSGCVAGDGTLELCFPERMLYDSGNNRLLVQDSTENAIMSINVVTGAISLIADATTTGESAFNGGYSMALDTPNNRLLIAEYNTNAISAINLSTGARTIISDNSTGTGPAFDKAYGVVLDSTNNRVIALDRNAKSVMAVDLTTGDRSIISSNAIGAGNDLISPSSIVRESGSGQVYVTDNRAIFDISLTNGNRSLVSDAPMSGPTLSFPIDAAWDYISNRLLAITQNGSELYSAKLDTGVREVIADQNITPSLQLTARQLGTNRTSVATLTGGRTQLVDLLTLNRTELSTAGSNVSTIDYANNRTLSYNQGTLAVTAINLGTGSETVVADLSALTPALYYCEAMVYDDDNNRLIVAATAINSQISGLYAVDMAAGTAKLISTQLLSNAAWKNIVDLSLDIANDQVYAMYNNLNASLLLRYNLTSGAGTMVNAPSAVSYKLPRGFYVDTEARRAFVADITLGGILVYDLDSGERALALR